MQTEHIFDIGPFLPDSHLSDDATPAQLAQEVKDPCLIFLNTQLPSSVIFISFGSSATVSSAPQLLDIAAGLEASNQPFFWLLRPPGTPGVSPASGPPAAISEFLPPGTEWSLFSCSKLKADLQCSQVLFGFRLFCLHPIANPAIAGSCLD